MKLSTIENYTHPKPACNSLYRSAWIIGHFISKWHLYNLVYWFRPPKLISVMLAAQDVDSIDDTDTFEEGMFLPGGFLADTPLACYIKLKFYGIKNPILVNAGLLNYRFFSGFWSGGLTLKRIKAIAKEIDSTNNNLAIDGID